MFPLYIRQKFSGFPKTSGNSHVFPSQDSLESCFCPLKTLLDSCLLSNVLLSSAHRSRIGTQTLFFIYITIAHIDIFCLQLTSLKLWDSGVELQLQQANYLHKLSRLFLKVIRVWLSTTLNFTHFSRFHRDHRTAILSALFQSIIFSMQQYIVQTTQMCKCIIH